MNPIDNGITLLLTRAQDTNVGKAQKLLTPYNDVEARVVKEIDGIYYTNMILVAISSEPYVIYTGKYSGLYLNRNLIQISFNNNTHEIPIGESDPLFVYGKVVVDNYNRIEEVDQYDLFNDYTYYLDAHGSEFDILNAYNMSTSYISFPRVLIKNPRPLDIYR